MTNASRTEELARDVLELAASGVEVKAPPTQATVRAEATRRRRRHQAVVGLVAALAIGVTGVAINQLPLGGASGTSPAAGPGFAEDCPSRWPGNDAWATESTVLPSDATQIRLCATRFSSTERPSGDYSSSQAERVVEAVEAQFRRPVDTSGLPIGCPDLVAPVYLYQIANASGQTSLLELRTGSVGCDFITIGGPQRIAGAGQVLELLDPES